MCHLHSNSVLYKNTRRKLRMVDDDVKIPFFHGNGMEDPEQYWFLYKMVWTIKKIQDEDRKK